MITMAWTGSYRLTLPFDGDRLREIEQMIDLGDATIDTVCVEGIFTHRVDFSDGRFWLVRMEN